MLHVDGKASLVFWSIFVHCINIINTFKNKIAMTYPVKNPCQSFPLHTTLYIGEELISLFKNNFQF